MYVYSTCLTHTRRVHQRYSVSSASVIGMEREGCWHRRLNTLARYGRQTLYQPAAATRFRREGQFVQMEARLLSHGKRR